MNLLELSDVIKDKGGAVTFLQRRGPLHEQRIYSRGHDMILSLRGAFKKFFSVAKKMHFLRSDLAETATE